MNDLMALKFIKRW